METALPNGDVVEARNAACRVAVVSSSAPLLRSAAADARAHALQMERVQFAAKEDRLDDKLNDGARRSR